MNIPRLAVLRLAVLRRRLLSVLEATVRRRTVRAVGLLLVLLPGLLLLVVVARLTVRLLRRIATLLRVGAVLLRIALRRRSVSARSAVLVGVLVVGIRHIESLTNLNSVQRDYL